MLDIICSLFQWVAPEGVLGLEVEIRELGGIGEVIAFLAHERASFVTGAVWTVDGGLLTLIGGTPRANLE